MIPIAMKDPKIVAALRLLETSIIVTLLGFLFSLQSALGTTAGLAGYDWHGALYSLEVGVLSGIVNAFIAYFQALQKQAESAAAATTTPTSGGN